MINLLTKEELAFWSKKYKNRGINVILTNGCFDILHAGHVDYLSKAAKCGNLWVGINSDLSVRALKGSTRPINTELNRAMVVGALKHVEFVTIFDSLTSAELIESIKPNLYVKGGDYSIDQLNVEEKRVLDSLNIPIKIIPKTINLSSSSFIR